MISPINNNQNIVNTLLNINKNSPIQNEETGKSPNEKIDEAKKPAVNNVQEAGVNSQGNTAIRKAIDILA